MVTLFRVCSIEGCAREHEARGWCHSHYRRWLRHGNPMLGNNFRGSEKPTYDAMHARIRRLRGRAGDHTCSCGDRAREWAYDHTDPGEQWGKSIAGSGCWMLYSADPCRYVALCARCHKRLDQDWSPPGPLWFRAYLAVPSC